MPAAADVAAAVRHRLDALKVANADVRVEGTDRIAIGFAKADPKTTERVENSLKHRGNLEFRILADRKHPADAKVVELAESPAQRGKQLVRDASGKVVAKWVITPPKVKVDAIVSRDSSGKREVLALIDEWNITGGYLVAVRKITLGGPGHSIHG